MFGDGDDSVRTILSAGFCSKNPLSSAGIDFAANAPARPGRAGKLGHLIRQERRAAPRIKIFVFIRALRG
jgi:hypothetical protein